MMKFPVGTHVRLNWPGETHGAFNHFFTVSRVFEKDGHTWYEDEKGFGYLEKDLILAEGAA